MGAASDQLPLTPHWKARLGESGTRDACRGTTAAVASLGREVLRALGQLLGSWEEATVSTPKLTPDAPQWVRRRGYEAATRQG